MIRSFICDDPGVESPGSSPTRERIVDSAFVLFARLGYDATTVDAIAKHAGVGRSTFFRSFGSKESVLFPDHDLLLQVVETRLSAGGAGSANAAVGDALRVVLAHFVAEGDRARYRYGLTSSVPSVRERELLNSARYQRLFARQLARWGDGSSAAQMHAELKAAAFVAAHNAVLRGWLRGEDADPHASLDDALAMVARTFDAPVDASPVVVVVREQADADAVLAAVRHLL